MGWGWQSEGSYSYKVKKSSLKASTQNCASRWQVLGADKSRPANRRPTDNSVYSCWTSLVWYPPRHSQPAGPAFPASYPTWKRPFPPSEDYTRGESPAWAERVAVETDCVDA